MAVAVAPAGRAASGQGIQSVGCGFDGSPESHRALAWAAELARTASAWLRVLSVYERVPAVSIADGRGLATASVNDVLHRQCEEDLARAVSALCPDIGASETLLSGDARELLARESSDVDLLVVGSRAYGPLRAVLLGSVSSALVRSAGSPLVVVPRGASARTAPQGPAQ